jgi:hypothetical protein
MSEEEKQAIIDFMKKKKGKTKHYFNELCKAVPHMKMRAAIGPAAAPPCTCCQRPLRPICTKKKVRLTRRPSLRSFTGRS